VGGGGGDDVDRDWKGCKLKIGFRQSIVNNSRSRGNLYLNAPEF
jgi:hypothetical protein